MSDRMKEELNVLKARRRAIRNDLKNLVVELSATSQVVLMFEAARIESEIHEIEQELETMAFEEFARYWRKTMGDLVELTRDELRDDLFGDQ